VQGHDFHVLQVLPGLDVAGDIQELILGAPVPHALARRGVREAGDDQRALGWSVAPQEVGLARPSHEKLAEVPLAGLHFGDLGVPDAAACVFPAIDDLPAGEDRLALAVCGPGDRCVLRAGVFRRQAQGFGQEPVAGLDADRHRAWEAVAGGLQRPDGIARAL